MPRLLELFCGTKSVGRAFEAAGWEVVSLDIVSKFEPTILCDIRSWDYTTLYSRALTTRPRRLLEGDALVLSALEIIAHFDPLMWVIENPATGLLKTRPFMERLPWVDVTYCKYGTPYRKQTRLWTTCAGGRGGACAGPAAAARRGRTAGTSGPRSGGRG